MRFGFNTKKKLFFQKTFISLRPVKPYLRHFGNVRERHFWTENPDIRFRFLWRHTWPIFLFDDNLKNGRSLTFPKLFFTKNPPNWIQFTLDFFFPEMTLPDVPKIHQIGVKNADSLSNQVVRIFVCPHMHILLRFGHGFSCEDFVFWESLWWHWYQKTWMILASL